MMVGNLLVGVVAYLGVVVAVILAMNVAGRVAARALGIPEFRWFSESVTDAPVWKSLVVRGVAMLGPWVLSFGLFWADLVINGAPTAPTTRVEVFADGAAKLAGMRSGDRLLAIGGRRVTTWEELRAAVPTEDTPVAIELERAGSRLELQVTPRRNRIGVAPFSEAERLGAVAAARRAASLPWTVVASAARSVWDMLTKQERADLGGPVRIVKESSSSAQRGVMLQFMAVLCAYLGACAASVAPVDTLLSWSFRARHRGHDLSLPAYQMQRAREGALVGLVGISLLFPGSLLTKAGMDASVLLALMGQPFAMALFPALWAGGGLVWKRSSRLLVFGASVTIPCVVLLAGFDLVQTLRRTIVAEGFDVGWFQITPKTRA